MQIIDNSNKKMYVNTTYFLQHNYIVSHITKSTISAYLHHMIVVYACRYATCNLMYKHVKRIRLFKLMQLKNVLGLLEIMAMEFSNYYQLNRRSHSQLRTPKNCAQPTNKNTAHSFKGQYTPKHQRHMHALRVYFCHYDRSGGNSVNRYSVNIPLSNQFLLCTSSYLNE